MKSCYGNYRASAVRCRDCRWQPWCCEAGDLALLSDRTSSTPNPETLPANREETICDREPRSEYYSRAELLELIRFMLTLDWETLDFLDRKLADPTVSFAGTARKWKISRQAVYKIIMTRCRRIPELAPLLSARYHNNHKPVTFMEAVCRIKRSVSRTHLKTPKRSLPYWKSSTFLSRNFDLSKMSILKGVIVSKSN